MGLLLPLGLIWWIPVTRSKVELVAILAIFGVLAEKTWMLAAGQSEPWLALPHGSYFPSWIELFGIIGIVAFGILLYKGVLRVV